MAAYPDIVSSVPAHDPLKQSLVFKTMISNFDDLGEETRKRKWLYPKRNLELTYQNITKAQGQTLWLFYKARSGAYEAFNFFYAFSASYTDEYVGTGNGSTLIFNLPSKGASSYTLKVDGATQTAGGVDYTFASEGGTDGADKATFVVAPATGKRITWDFTGYLKVRARFAEDNLDWDTFYDRLVTSGLELKGLLNE